MADRLADGQTDCQTARQIHRQTDQQTDRQADRQTCRNVTELLFLNITTVIMGRGGVAPPDPGWLIHAKSPHILLNAATYKTPAKGLAG